MISELKSSNSNKNTAEDDHFKKFHELLNKDVYAALPYLKSISDSISSMKKMLETPPPRISKYDIAINANAIGLRSIYSKPMMLCVITEVINDKCSDSISNLRKDDESDD